MVTNQSPLEQELWDKWLRNKESETANDLISHYMYLVHFHVDRTASHLPSNVDKDDLKSFGLLGLYDALNKFEPDRNLKFDTYASFRVQGAIIDGLRKNDWLPRSLREKTKKIENISQKLEQVYHRTPSAEEIATEAGMTVKEVETIVRDSLFANVLSIEDKPKDASAERKEGVGYAIPDEMGVMPDESLLKKELIGELKEGLKVLNKNEQMIISLFYNDELTLTEIGHVLGLTTSRISQIHKKAIFKLRKILTRIQVS